MTLYTLLVTALLSATSVSAHMAMISPCPRYSSHASCPSPPAGQSVDYSIKSPIGTKDQIGQPLCKFQTPYDRPVATYEAGSSIPVEFMTGGASHGGGHCQFSLSYDGGSTFVVLHSVLNHCFGSGLQFSVPIPSNAPSSDRVVFSWSWVNAVGNREFYQNCADIAITGGDPHGELTGPQMVVANYGPSSPLVPEFSYGGDSKNDLYDQAPTITVRAAGASAPQYHEQPAVASSGTPPSSNAKDSYGATPVTAYPNQTGAMSTRGSDEPLSPQPSSVTSVYDGRAVRPSPTTNLLTAATNLVVPLVGTVASALSGNSPPANKQHSSASISSNSAPAPYYVRRRL
ncbi:hypothetical protein IWQ60_003518 [Tieghemiomyces parasiticus]|uniref:Chitin-binding type-4 domain-containing protein n=1 Tax=Tieghemiomyces parasiticus TaxID=78921 RepID=A0A9W8E0L2_9FUNG|nr:hypothetical protein IWQ60_003518 [Tieghemiomyces parasiticus]